MPKEIDVNELGIDISKIANVEGLVRGISPER